MSTIYDNIDLLRYDAASSKFRKEQAHRYKEFLIAIALLKPGLIIPDMTVAYARSRSLEILRSETEAGYYLISPNPSQENR